VNYRGHVIGGLFFYLIALVGIWIINQDLFNNKPLLLFGLCATIIGSLFPDIDTTSKARRLLYGSVVLLFLMSVLAHQGYMAALCIAVLLIVATAHHRGLFHNLLFLVGFTCVISWVLVALFPPAQRLIAINSVFFLWGIISHKLLDIRRGF
jgi:membrane-bound metal-dependent hydrolase YbcI (DUF457 family)